MATDVLWLSTPSPTDLAQIEQVLEPPTYLLAPVDLRSALDRVTLGDDDAMAALQRTLDEAMAQTDPEADLSTLERLDVAISGVELCRDASDRAQLRAALLHQGSRVHRLFGDTIEWHPDARRWREYVHDQGVVRPWLSAIAMAPEDLPSLALGQQAYEATRTSVGDAVATLRLPVDPTAQVLVDGSPREPRADGSLELMPGRHLVHQERQGRVIERWDVWLEAGSETLVEPRVDEPSFRRFLESASQGTKIPPMVATLLAAMDREVWFARPRNDAPPLLLRVRAGQLESVSLATAPPRPSLHGSITPFAGLTLPGEGSPLPRLGVAVDGRVQLGLGEIGLGVDAWLWPGRPQLLPHAAAGLDWVQVAVGWFGRSAASAGLRTRVAVSDKIQVRGAAWITLPVTGQREDVPVLMLGAGLGYTAPFGRRRLNTAEMRSDRGVDEFGGWGAKSRGETVAHDGSVDRCDPGFPFPRR